MIPGTDWERQKEIKNVCYFAGSRCQYLFASKNYRQYGNESLDKMKGKSVPDGR